MNKNSTKSQPQGQRPQYIKYMWWVFGGLWLLVFLFFTFLSIGWIGDMPQFEDIENPHSLQASEVISDDGEVARGSQAR